MKQDDPLGQRSPRRRPTIAHRLEQPPYGRIAVERLVAHAATMTASEATALVAIGDDGADPGDVAGGKPVALAGEPHACSVPIMIGTTTYGALEAARSQAAYTPDEERALTDVADLVGLVFEHSRLPPGVQQRSREQTDDLARALQLRSRPTISRDVEVDLAVAVAESLGLDAASVVETELATLLQDVGSLGVPQDVLDKGVAADAEDRALLARIPGWSAESVARVAGLEAVALVVLHCRAPWSGAALEGVRIPVESRIVNACAAYRVAASARPFGRGETHEAALASLRAEAGTRFDPAVVDALEAVVRARFASIT
jgi:hypothetical protein